MTAVLPRSPRALPTFDLRETDHKITLTVGTRTVTNAVLGAFGWQVWLGRNLVTALPSGKPRPGRCAWWSTPDKDTAVMWLRHIGAGVAA